MAITILSDPSHVIQVSPEIISRWVATESPNIFELQRKDWVVLNAGDDGNGFMSIDPDTEYTGSIGNIITVYDAFNGGVYIGEVTDIIITSPNMSIITDIAWGASMTPSYFNDSTIYDGYYFEGRLTINGIVHPLTIMASPNSAGVAELDVSSILRIMTSMVKTADYTTDLAAEPTKSGRFTFAYRGMYYGAEDTIAYIEEGNTWHYVEAVRSEEQGSNLYDFLFDGATDAPFLNMFANPVMWAGLPFDISFILPPVTGSPTSVTITKKVYNAANTLLDTEIDIIDVSALEGYVASLNIAFAALSASATYVTIEIE